MVELGNLERDLGDLAKALALYEKGLLLAERATDNRVEAGLLSEMALLAMMNGELDVAAERLARARQLAEPAGDAELELSILERLAVLSYTEGALAELAQHVAEARSLCESARLEHRLAGVGLYQGWADLESGDMVAARRRFGEAERQFRSGGDVPGLAAALTSLAAIERSEGRDTEARSRLAELGEIRDRLGFAEPAWEMTSTSSSDERAARLVRILSALPLTPLRERALRRLAGE